MLIDLNFVVQVYRSASGTKEFSCLADRVEKHALRKLAKTGSFFFVLLFRPSQLALLTLQLNVVRSYMNWQVFNSTYDHLSLIWMTEFHCQLWIGSSYLLLVTMK